MHDPDAEVGKDLGVDGCWLLARYDERQAKLPSLLGPPDEDLFGKPVGPGRAELVWLVIDEPNLLGAPSMGID
jgi:hypothetical protein